MRAPTLTELLLVWCLGACGGTDGLEWHLFEVPCGESQQPTFSVPDNIDIRRIVSLQVNSQVALRTPPSKVAIQPITTVNPDTREVDLLRTVDACEGTILIAIAVAP